MTPISLPSSLSITLLLALAMGGAGYWAGDYNRNNAWLAKQAVAERQAREALQAEVQRGQAAAAKLTTDRQALQNSYSTLEGKFNGLLTHGSLVVKRNSAAGSNCIDGNAQPVTPGTLDRSGASTTTMPSGSLAAPVGAGGADDLGLSLGAVWMWNSALTGTDAPAGACEAADPTAPACSDDSGIGIEAAWANHAVNAKSCALDRLAHQRLIDFVTAGTPP